MKKALPTVTVPGLLLAGVSLLAAGCAGPASRPAAAAASQHRTGAAPAPGGIGEPGQASTGSPSLGRAATPAASSTVLPVPPPPGRLHQTRAFPSPHSSAFRAEMTDLWAAVVTGRARLGGQAFFPLTAYTQVKAIADPAADWHSRLFGDFRLDVAAAHHFLGRGPARHSCCGSSCLRPRPRGSIRGCAPTVSVTGMSRARGWSTGSTARCARSGSPR